jgi:aryl-alcohol dehydrogenase-like predicted oxidoreductase
VERRRLGRTGHESSVAILGGAACWAATVDEAGAWLQLALDHGVNHLDIAPQYGAAESVVGPHLAAHREELFIAGKTLRANPEGVQDQFDTTRRLLNADVLDLYQAHAVTTLEELDRRSAALERILRCVTPATPASPASPATTWRCRARVLEALRRFDLDTVMFPVYPALWARPEYREPAEELLALCAERDLGVMVIKAVARRPWADGRPLADAVAGSDATSARWATRGTSRRPVTTSSTAASTSPSPRRACTGSAPRATSRLLPRVLALGRALRAAERGPAPEAMEPWRPRS